ncbi:MAG: pantetheine-phosphate adenylyltransferase [Verrucomicrobiales bacterium]|nr:pantetheine-phosphate adenylyltransferase [Verrucomicrobiales bacterium]
MKTAIYPGSFDPIHNGHLDVIERASKLWDRMIVAVAFNGAKTGLFTPDERVKLIKESTSHLNNVEVTSFEGLLVDFVRANEADVVIRGLRAVSDFEYEFQMALMNRSLDENLETVFLMPSQESIYLSSRIVKEVASLGGSIDQFVPNCVKAELGRKLEGPGRE